MRFLENHDEPRAAATLTPDSRERMCAVAIATLPGCTLWHQGQAEGRRIFQPVFLERPPPRDAGRCPESAFHRQLWAFAPSVRVGDWRMCDVHGWPDNTSADRLAAWTWTDGSRLTLVVVNLGDEPADGVVDVRHLPAAGQVVELVDLLDAESYKREGDDLAYHGLYVGRPGWGAHVLQLTV